MFLKKFKEIKLKKRFLEIEKIISEENFYLKNKKLKKILLENYDLQGIGHKQYLWDILRYPNLKVEYKEIEPFNINLTEINSTSFCNYFNGIDCSTQFERKLLKYVSKKTNEGVKLEVDISTIDDYVNESGMLIHFLKEEKKKGKFSDNLNNKIRQIENEKKQEKILEELSRSEITEVIEVFKAHSDTGNPSIFQDNNRIKVSLVPYSNEIEWNNSGSTHHFMLLNYIFKKINDSFEFVINDTTQKFQIEFLKELSIKKIFDENSLFILPDYKEVSNNLKICNINVINHNVEISLSSKLYNLEKDITINFLLVSIPNNRINNELKEIFKQNKVFNLEIYYQKYLRNQKENLEYYLQKDMITEDIKKEIENS